MSLIKRFERNQAGRDFAVGDIHGHFTRLQVVLDTAGFDPARDRLFSVGDLVDRGPESEQVLAWLDKPWFHAIQGNHEDIAVRHVQIGRVDQGIYLANGGAWFLGLPSAEQQEIATRFADLPIAIEVQTSAGLVGLVHADCPFPSWTTLCDALEGRMPGLRRVEDACQWSRHRVEQQDASGVQDILAVVVGHTPLRRPVVLGNVFHIDTMGWRPQNGGYFTLLDLETLETDPSTPAAMDWRDDE